MNIATPELFGTPEQIASARRAHALWSLLRDDPRFAFYGRLVAVAGPQDNTVDLVAGISRLTGFSSCQFFPAVDFAQHSAALAAHGLNPLRWEQHWGREAAAAAARSFLGGYTAPRGVELHQVTATTPGETLARIAALSLECGVMPVSAPFLRGQAGRGLCLYATDASGRVIATGGSFLHYHRNSRLADQAFWGMLATDDAFRGQRLAVWIGAALIVGMWERHGARGFSTGVKADNGASQAMCARLEVNRSEFVYLAAADPAVMGDQPITR